MMLQSTLLTFGFACGTFERWLQNFGFVWTDSKFQSFKLGDGESSKSQHRSYLLFGSWLSGVGLFGVGLFGVGLFGVGLFGVGLFGVGLFGK
jgi:hypothetical protein